MAEDTRDSSRPEDSPSSQNCGSDQNPLQTPKDDLKDNLTGLLVQSVSPDCCADEKTNKPESCESQAISNSNLHYEGDTCVYTDPGTKYQYTWDSSKNEWVPRTDNKQEHVAGKNSETDKKIADTSTSEERSALPGQDYIFDGESYCYKEEKTGITYKYDNDQKKWVVKASKDADEEKDSDDSDEDDNDNVIKQDMTKGTYGFEGDTHTYTDPTDGTVYFWDREKSAWFPKVDEDFLAHYQMNYGFTDNSVASSADKEPKTEEKDLAEIDEASLKRKAPQEPSWFEMDDEHNTKVYVNNLPLDITEQEFVDVMQKCGLVMKDVDTGKMKIKLYTEPGTDRLKGDGLCSYIKIESVDLAIKLLDGYDIRGHKLHVERAKFQMKGSYDPNLKPKKKKKKDKEKIKKMQEKLFDWRPDKLRGERSKHEKVVIVKNLFDPKIFDKDVALILEYQQDLREECLKCGDVRKVTIYDRHPEGVAQINFKEAEAADACVALLNGRWFGQRKITAETWDGKTKYRVAETDAEIQERLQKWNKFLESEEAAKEKAKNSVSEKTETQMVEAAELTNDPEEKKIDTNVASSDDAISAKTVSDSENVATSLVNKKNAGDSDGSGQASSGENGDKTNV